MQRYDGTTLKYHNLTLFECYKLDVFLPKVSYNPLNVDCFKYLIGCCWTHYMFDMWINTLLIVFCESKSWIVVITSFLLIANMRKLCAKGRKNFQSLRSSNSVEDFQENKANTQRRVEIYDFGGATSNLRHNNFLVSQTI